MKLNKKECRKYADPDLTMPPDHGLLYAPQVDYIVHTEVKVIDHHRTLILFVYPRAQAAQGDFCPPLDRVPHQGRLHYPGTQPGRHD